MKALSNIQIEHILAHNGIKINGIFSKDKLPKEFKQGWYIINLQNENEGRGTHWTCFKVFGKELLYYDSMGFICPLEVLKGAKDYVIYNTEQIQNDLSSSCGWFCIALIENDDKSSGSSLRKFAHFLAKFSNNTKVNERILQRIFA